MSEEHILKGNNKIVFVNYNKSLHCPSCFVNWNEASPIVYAEDETKLCDVCEKGLSPRALMRRQLQVLDSTYASDFPKVIRNLAKYIDLDWEHDDS